MTTVFGITSKTTSARVRATAVGRADAVIRVAVSTRDPQAHIADGVLRACGERFVRVRDISLLLASHMQGDMEVAVATGFPRLASFWSGITPLTGPTLRALLAKKDLTTIGADIGDISSAEHADVWLEFASRRMDVLFLRGGARLSQETLAVLARNVSSDVLILDEPVAISAANVTDLMKRCNKVQLLGDAVLSSPGARTALLAQSRPGQLEFSPLLPNAS
jgi:hypothetical protein